MFEIISPGLRFDFVAWAKQAILLSVLVIVIGLVAIVVRGGLNLGIDLAVVHCCNCALVSRSRSVLFAMS
jgi:preprotein translocase subunit SecF